MDSTLRQRYERALADRFRSDERAVTPVVGVILLVALAVILASIVGAFAFGLQDRVQDHAPNTRFDFDYSPGDQTGELCGLSDDDGTDEGKVTISHESGGVITESQLTLVDDEGNEATWNACASTAVTEIGAGDTATPEIDSDDTIRLRWESENDADDTAILATYEAPDA